MIDADRVPEAVSDCGNVPFAWGRSDCCLFAADVLERLHGVDYAAAWRGRYRTEFGACRILVKAGGLRALAASVFGEAASPLQARRGDPVIFEHPQRGEQSLGICTGTRVAFKSPAGVVFLPLASCLCCWRI